MHQREAGLDLLRCLALLFVVTFHSFLYNGYYWPEQTGTHMWLAGSFRWLSVSCVGLFLMLTGYLKSRHTDWKSCYRSLPPVLLAYFFAAIITIPIRHFAFGDVQTFKTWLTRLFSFNALYYGWYVEMYVGLILLSPFLNIVLDHLREKKAFLGLAATMLTITALPGATPLGIAPDYWRICYPITYYILGGVVRRIQPKLNPWVGISGAVAVSTILGAATVLSTDGDLKEALTWEFADLWIVGIVVLLFTSLYRIRVSPRLSKVFCFCAKGCYGGYLLSHLFDGWCYKLVPQWKTPNKYFLIFICVTVPIFLVSMLLGVLLQTIINLLCRRSNPYPPTVTSMEKVSGSKSSKGKSAR